MKILQAHNFYQIGGGEDTVVATEGALLRQNGHEIIQYYKENEVIKSFSFFQKLELLKKTTYNSATYTEVKDIIVAEKPDICHVHNFLPLISPAIFKACYDCQIPVVLTLHNYRLMCTNGILYRNNQICEECIGRSAYHALKHRCYRNSTSQTYAVARMLEKNKANQLWENKIDAYICLTAFAKEKFIAHGLPPERLFVKGNFIDVNPIEKDSSEMPYFLFVGRLDESKGMELVLNVAKKSPLKIKVIGEGEYTNFMLNQPNIDYLGRLSHEDTLRFISQAKALIFPSLWYEGMPMTILEAMSQKTVVIASDLGAMKSMLNHKETGLLFEPNQPIEALKLLHWSMKNSTEMAQIAERAFTVFNERYAAETNYLRLMEIYTHTIEQKRL